MSIPVRMSVRVVFDDGRQHEYDVRSALAEQATGLLALAGPVGDAEALAAFLEARLAEAEATAHLAGEGRTAWVTVRDKAGQMLYTTVAADLEGEENGWIADGNPLVDESARVFYDTERTLRDIEAKRMILTRWEFARNQVAVGAVNEAAGYGSADPGWPLRADSHELDARSLAAVWSDHADYREAWAL